VKVYLVRWPLYSRVFLWLVINRQARATHLPITERIILRRGRAPRKGASHIVNVKQTAPQCTTPAIAEALIMLRQHFVRSLQRPAQRAVLNGSRAFSVSATRRAEVELTIGVCHCPLRAAMYANALRRWKEGENRRYATLLHEDARTEPLLTPPRSRCIPHPGV
jgi:hypothetical protein